MVPTRTAGARGTHRVPVQAREPLRAAAGRPVRARLEVRSLFLPPNAMLYLHLYVNVDTKVFQILPSNRACRMITRYLPTLSVVIQRA